MDRTAELVLAVLRSQSCGRLDRRCRYRDRRCPGGVLAIEEMHAEQAVRLGCAAKVPSMKALKEFESTVIGWHLSLTRLEHYLAHINCPSA